MAKQIPPSAHDRRDTTRPDSVLFEMLRPAGPAILGVDLSGNCADQSLLRRSV
jgi:hypothetical protein